MIPFVKTEESRDVHTILREASEKRGGAAASRKSQPAETHVRQSSRFPETTSQDQENAFVSFSTHFSAEVQCCKHFTAVSHKYLLP
jgi:hypothetical protein